MQKIFVRIILRIASSVALGYREDIRFTKAKKKTREELIVFDVDK